VKGVAENRVDGDATIVVAASNFLRAAPQLPALDPLSRRPPGAGAADDSTRSRHLGRKMLWSLPPITVVAYKWLGLSDDIHLTDAQTQWSQPRRQESLGSADAVGGAHPATQSGVLSPVLAAQLSGESRRPLLDTHATARPRAAAARPAAAFSGAHLGPLECK